MDIEKYIAELPNTYEAAFTYFAAHQNDDPPPGRVHPRGGYVHAFEDGNIEIQLGNVGLSSPSSVIVDLIIDADSDDDDFLRAHLFPDGAAYLTQETDLPHETWLKHFKPEGWNCTRINRGGTTESTQQWYLVYNGEPLSELEAEAAGRLISGRGYHTLNPRQVVETAKAAVTE